VSQDYPTVFLSALGVDDQARAAKAMRGIAGKRLKYETADSLGS
jgi:hypothetical protein